MVLSLGTGDEQLSDIVLNYKNLTTGKHIRQSCRNRRGYDPVYHGFSENGQAGEYQITSVQFTHREKTKQEILLSDLGMDVRFGVNEQAETNPDQVTL